jgi:hypothetical protein
MKYHEGGRPAPDRPRLIVGAPPNQTCTKSAPNVVAWSCLGRNRTADGQRQIHDSGSFVAWAATGRNTLRVLKIRRSQGLASSSLVSGARRNHQAFLVSVC